MYSNNDNQKIAAARNEVNLALIKLYGAVGLLEKMSSEKTGSAVATTKIAIMAKRMSGLADKIASHKDKLLAPQS